MTETDTSRPKAGFPVKCAVGRHRRPCGFAIVRDGSVEGAAARRGIGPAAKRKGGDGLCASKVDRRSLSTFHAIRAGNEGRAVMWATTRRAQIRNQQRRRPTVSLTSASADRAHDPARPVAAHQLGKQVDNISIRSGGHHDGYGTMQAGRHRPLIDAVRTPAAACGSGCKAGIGPCCINQKVRRCESTDGARSTSTFASMRAGLEDSARVWVTTSAALIRNRRTSLAIGNWTLGFEAGTRNAGFPVAAHQLDAMM